MNVLIKVLIRIFADSASMIDSNLVETLKAWSDRAKHGKPPALS